MTRVLGLRGATTASTNSKGAILTSTKDLLQEIIDSNDLEVKELAAVYFTVTQDLNAEFPALAARQLGWDNVALLCAQEMDVPNAPRLCIRVLILANSDLLPEKVTNVYLEGAINLRDRGNEKD
tara:strand:- start:127 stop:498 length:372 start_codon:yes stop_codon:yes gene_type:complete